MTRAGIAALVLLAFAGSAEAAGWRRHCGRTYQNIYSTVGWSNPCYECHKPNSFHGAKAQGRTVPDLIAGLAGQQAQYAAMIEGLDRLGFKQTGQQGYGQSGSAYMSGGSYSHHTGALNPLGDSLYVRPNAEINALAIMNAVERAATQTGQLAGQGYAAIADIGGQQLEVAKINAVRDAAVATLRAAQPSAPPQFREFRFTTKIDQSGNVQVVPDQGQQLPPTGGGLQPFDPAQAQGPGDYGVGAALERNGCLGCHSAEKKQGDLDLSNFAALPDAEKAAVAWQCFTAMTRTENRMPKDKPPAPPEDIAAFSVLAAALAAQPQGTPNGQVPNQTPGY